MPEKKNTLSKAQKLATRLQRSSERTLAFFQSVDGPEWGEQIYSEGANWTIKEILAHFVVSENSITRLIKYVLKGYPGVPEEFDIDAFNEKENRCFSKLPTEAVLVRFCESRADTIAMVSALSDEELATEGRHPWLGITSVEEMIKLMYRHNQIHQRDIRKCLDH